jgi:hypothetical protein
MVNQQLQVAKQLLPGPWPIESRLPQRRPGDRERVDRIRLPARPVRAPLGRVGCVNSASEQRSVAFAGETEFAHATRYGGR